MDLEARIGHVARTLCISERSETMKGGGGIGGSIPKIGFERGSGGIGGSVRAR